MLDERKIRLIREFIENPNVEKAISIVEHPRGWGLDVVLCEELGDEHVMVCEAGLARRREMGLEGIGDVWGRPYHYYYMSCI